MSGTAACRGLQHLLLGSVSGALAAAEPCPVVVVAPNDALRQPGPVLVGDDGSEHAMRAVRHAEALAARLGSDLVLLHVEEGDAGRRAPRATPPLSGGRAWQWPGLGPAGRCEAAPRASSATPGARSSFVPEHAGTPT